MPQPRARCQRQLFEEPPAVPAVRFPLDVQEQLRQALVQWMQALAVLRLTDNCSAMATSDCPSAAASTIRQRRATCWGVPWADTHCCI